MTTDVRRPRALITALVAALALGLAGCAGASDVPTGSTTDSVGFFDSSLVHTIELTVDPVDVDAMMREYQTSGEKTWIPATVTIDGTTVSDAGIRLKGNSSLRTLDPDADPATFPWLVRLDTYVDGQSYEGLTSFVVRSNVTATALNEAVALELIEAAGLAGQEATPVRLTVNDGTTELRLVIENPDDAWAASTFDADGLLYKSEAEGDWSYRGDDPASYADVFDQEAGEEDLTPLIELLDFLNNSDDATFAAELADHLDVEAFARYLAVQELVDNFDTISGPGNNSYLWYDTEAEMFTVVSWDQNLSFGLSPNAVDGAGDRGAIGTVPGGTAPGERPTMPGDLDPDALPADGVGDQGGVGGRGGMGAMGGNILEERFRATPELAALYDEAVAELTAELVDSGVGADVLATWVEVLTEKAGDLVDTSVIEQEANAVAGYL